MAQDELSREHGDMVRALKQERGACPSASALVEYHALTPQGRSSQAIDGHVHLCSRCQLVLLHLDEPPVRAPMVRWPWAAAAALLLAFAAPAVYQRMVDEAPPETVRGTEIQPITPVGEVSAVTAFEWQSPIRAARYRVRVYRGAQEIWTSTSDSTRLEVTEPVPLERGAEHAWIVEAIDAAGEVRVRSPRQTFIFTR